MHVTRTHASNRPSSAGSLEMCACMSSSAFALVVLSRFDRFLKSTFTPASEMPERSGGSVTYESCDDATPKAAAEEPKVEPNAEAAFALLACAFAVRLLMAGLRGSETVADDWRVCSAT
jgi:hypothetical protein